MKCTATSTESVREIRHQVREEIKTVASEVSSRVVDDVLLTTGEVVTNVVKHCGEQNSGSGFIVDIWFTKEDNHLVEHIKTESHCAHKEEIENALDADAYNRSMESISLGREGGIGLAIIGAITEDHSVTPEGEMVLVFAL